MFRSQSFVRYMAATSSMPWRCPACETVIQHREAEPQPKSVYRCPVCRLELVRDAQSGKLTLAPVQPPST